MQFPENPVLTKELRTRMRGTRAYWILLAYIGLPSLVVLLTYVSYTAFQNNSNGGQAAFQLGKVFYSTVFTIQALLVGLITPALTAGGVSLEKEQRTYDLLSLTKLPRRAIIQGKLFAATLFVALLLTASLPLVSICFLLGGVSPSQVISAYMILLSCAFLYGSVGIASSSVAKSTTNATSLAYGMILVIFFCTLPLALMGMSRSFSGGGGSSGYGLTGLNPIGAVGSGNLSEVYFGLTLPAWLPALLVNSLFGTVLTVTAIHRLEYPRTDRTPLLRLLCAGLTFLLAFFFYGFLAPNAPGGLNHNNAMAAVAMLTLCGAALMAAVFSTGDAIVAPGSLLRLIFDPRRLRVGDAASGLLYSVLLVLICGGVLYVGIDRASHDAVLKLMLLTLAFLWLLGTMGILLSQVARSRWAALAATLAFTSVLSITPMFSQINTGGQTRKPTFADNLLYLSPFPAAMEVSGENMKDLRSPKLVFGKTPFLPITAALYGIGGIVFLMAAEGSRKGTKRGETLLHGNAQTL